MRSQPIRNFSANGSAAAVSGQRAQDIPTSSVFLKMRSLWSAAEFPEAAGDSGKSVSRGFCPKYGSSLLWKFAALPGLALVTAGSLDDPSVFKPQAVLYTSQGHAWDHLNPELPKFEKLWPRD